MSARWLAQPLVHFVAIGGLLFALDRLAQGEQAEPAITITPERIAELREDWLARAGRLPSAAELEALVEREVDEELLLREARRLGFQRSDPLVRRRLVQNMRFVSSDDGGDPDTLLSQALALGMDRKDLVVRRRLVQKMELGAFAAARTREPSEPELREFLARHPERFSEPSRVRLSHVYLSRDRRGDELDAASRRLLARLADGHPSPERAPALGDPFLAGHDLPLLSERELAKLFGADFARAALGLAPGAWRGPLASSYGRHLVWVHGRSAARPSSLDSVRGEVREALLAERGEAALRELLRRLRARAAVHVARPRAGAADAPPPGPSAAKG